MAHPTRARCDVTESEEMFVWDATAVEWRCNDCGALKSRAPLIKVDINGARSEVRTIRGQYRYYIKKGT